MRASTLCFIALACLMTQFTQALPVNSKREIEVGSANTKNGLDSSSAAGTGIEAPGSDAKALAATAASKDKAIAVAAADSNGTGPEFAQSKAVDKHIGPVDLAAAAALAGAADNKKPGAAVVGALAGGAGVDGIVTVTGAATNGKTVGQGGAGEGLGGAGSATVANLGTLAIAKSGDIEYTRPGANSSI
ncbi:uncharacterized protein EV154DRAFT_514931 [Mucor mucedo]|uniref:uncharacterized protein n=1 Tax=Mucor mucedo TaxID=29922 RepID=UPI0022200309|nr:uncharacterized protein EV154DRAFT_514931 [Mucor mucedo]KAI7889380.1 hypothetical protein EV154DRAFT_514931 [Mucor mucedo]